jgi:ABC-type bacteriocin/lantibiotic exporter with double-glycine peptidase domain
MDMFFIIFFSVFGGYIIYTQEKNMNLPNILKIFISVSGFTATGLASMEYITWNIAMIMIVASLIICMPLEFIYKKLKEQNNK